MIRRFLDSLSLARTVLVLSDRVSELSRRLRAEGERADRADRLADYYRAAEDRAIAAAVRAEARARAAEQEELRGREERIGASHGEYALRTGLDHARRRWRERAWRAEDRAFDAEETIRIIHAGDIPELKKAFAEQFKRAGRAESEREAAEHDLAIVQHNHHVRAGKWRIRLMAGLWRKQSRTLVERDAAQYERDEARHELAELRANLDAAEARLRAGRP